MRRARRRARGPGKARRDVDDQGASTGSIRTAMPTATSSSRWSATRTSHSASAGRSETASISGTSRASSRCSTGSPSCWPPTPRRRCGSSRARRTPTGWPRWGSWPPRTRWGPASGATPTLSPSRAGTSTSSPTTTRSAPITRRPWPGRCQDNATSVRVVVLPGPAREGGRLRLAGCRLPRRPSWPRSPSRRRSGRPPSRRRRTGTATATANPTATATTISPPSRTSSSAWSRSRT